MSNESILQLFKLLGNIQNLLKVVHITGTNGKGSTLNHISRFLKNCGTFTSPYLLSPLDSRRIFRRTISTQDYRI